MYPSDELERLALQKDLLIARSNLLRVQLFTTTQVLVQPVSWVQSALAIWKKAAPFLGLGSVLFMRSRPGKKLGWLTMALKWAPTLLRTFRTFKQAGKSDPNARYSASYHE